MSRRQTFPGTLRRRGDSYWWRVRIHPDRFSRSFPTTDRHEAIRQARAAYADLEAEVERRRAGIRTGIHVSDLLDEFQRDYLPRVVASTRRTYGVSLASFRRFFVAERGDPLVVKVRKADVSAYLDWRRHQRGGRGNEPVSQRTLRKDYTVLHTLFEWAREHREYRPDNPVVKQLTPKRGDERQPIILTDDQAARLVGACEGRPMLKLFVTLCYETGLRPNSEALWLRWEDLDLDAGYVRVRSGRDGHRTKTGKSRSVPISSPLATALREHLARFRFSGSPWVFHHLTTRRHAQAGERLGGLLHAYQNAARRAKLPPELRPYDLRHTRLTRWVTAGHNLALVQKVAGHASIRTTMIYVHLNDGDLQTLVMPPTPPATTTLDLKAAWVG